MTMARRVGVNSVWLILQPLFLNVVTLVATGYITRQLGRSGYGIFNAGFAYVAAFTPIANLGLRTVGVRAMAERPDDGRTVFGALFLLRLLLAGIVALLAIGTASWSANTPGGRSVIVLATVSMALLVVTQSLGDRFRACEKMRPVALADMVGGLSLTGLSVLALALGYGLLGFTVAYCAGTAISTLLAGWFYLRAFGLPRLLWRWSEMKDLLSQARPFFVMQLVTGWTDKPVLDILLLQYYFGPGVAGLYAAVALLVNRLGVIPQGVTGALFPAVARGYAERRAEVEQTVRQSILYLALATLPLAAAVSFLARPIVLIVFGSDYLPSAPVLATLIWVVPLLGPNLLMYDCLSAVRRQNAAVAITLAGGVGLIALFAVFIPLYGPVGAAVSLVVREVLLFLILLREMRRSFTEPVPFGQIGKAAIALLVMVVPLALAVLRFPLGLQIACAVGGGLLYGLVLMKMGVVRIAAVREWIVAARA